MSNAGYGNHDEPPPATQAADALPRVESRPDVAETAPHPASIPAVKPQEGAGPSGPQGDEVDPGVG